MAKKGVRKSKKAKKAPAKAPPKAKEKINPVIEPEIEAEKPKDAEEPSAQETHQQPGVPTFRPEVPMVNLRAKIHDVGMHTITVPEAMVDDELEKIWRTGFKQKLNNRQRTHQVYGPQLIDRIDIEPVL